MARRSGGREQLEQAKKVLSKARTVGELKQAQAVILPLEYGFSIEQTASVIGVSKGWACRLRTQFINSDGACIKNKPKRGGRRRENMSVEEEKEFLAPYFEKAASGGILIVGEIKQSLDRKLGREAALASVYNLLHRHGWRKLVPDKRHPKADVEAQDEWKKNSQI
jgi:transposase